MATTKRLQAEAVLEDVEFEFDGDPYAIPHPKRWPLEAIEAEEAGKVVGFLRELLGKEQFATFKAKPRTLEDLDKIYTAVIEAADLDMEKSKGSGAS